MTTDPARLRCPMCSAELRSGKLSVHGTFLDLAIFGLSSQHLWWIGADGQKEREIASSGRRAALRCSVCGTVVLPPRGFRSEITDNA